MHQHYGFGDRETHVEPLFELRTVFNITLTYTTPDSGFRHLPASLTWAVASPGLGARTKKNLEGTHKLIKSNQIKSK